MSDRIAILLREVNVGVAAMADGAGRVRQALAELERAGLWRSDYATFADYVERVIGLPPETLEPFMSCPLPGPEPTH